MDLKINNGQKAQSFTALQVQKSKMSVAQKVISEALCDSIQYCDRYQPLAERDINTIILPGKTPKSVSVRYMDIPSWTYVKIKDEYHILQRDLMDKGTKKIQEFADLIIKDLEDILGGKISRPKVNPDKIISGDTDMARLDRSEYLDLKNTIRELRKEGLDEETARELVIDHFGGTYLAKNKNI